MGHWLGGVVLAIPFYFIFFLCFIGYQSGCCWFGLAIFYLFLFKILGFWIFLLRCEVLNVAVFIKLSLFWILGSVWLPRLRGKEGHGFQNFKKFSIFLPPTLQPHRILLTLVKFFLNLFCIWLRFCWIRRRQVFQILKFCTGNPWRKWL